MFFDLFNSGKPLGEGDIIGRSLLSSSSLLKSYASAEDFLWFIPNKVKSLFPFIPRKPNFAFLIFIFSFCKTLFSLGEPINKERKSL